MNPFELAASLDVFFLGVAGCMAIFAGALILQVILEIACAIADAVRGE